MKQVELFTSSHFMLLPSAPRLRSLFDTGTQQSGLGLVSKSRQNQGMA